MNRFFCLLLPQYTLQAHSTGSAWYGEKQIRFFAPLIVEGSNTIRACLGLYMNRFHRLFDPLEQPT